MRLAALGDGLEDWLGDDETDEMLIQHFIGGLGVGVRDFILHNRAHVFSAILEDEVSTARVGVEEWGDVVDIGADCHVA